MKKIVTAVLVLVLLVSCAASALAVSATYASTKAFCGALDDAGITYTVKGIDDDGDELVTIGNRDDNDVTYTIRCWFSDDSEYMNIRIWDICSFTASNVAKGYEICNTLNNTYKYAKFMIYSDYTMTCSYDVILGLPREAGTVGVEAILRLVNIIEAGYSEYKNYR